MPTGTGRCPFTMFGMSVCPVQLVNSSHRLGWPCAVSCLLCPLLNSPVCGAWTTLTAILTYFLVSKHPWHNLHPGYERRWLTLPGITLTEMPNEVDREAAPSIVTQVLEHQMHNSMVVGLYPTDGKGDFSSTLIHFNLRPNCYTTDKRQQLMSLMLSLA